MSARENKSVDSWEVGDHVDDLKSALRDGTSTCPDKPARDALLRAMVYQLRHSYHQCHSSGNGSNGNGAESVDISIFGQKISVKGLLAVKAVWSGIKFAVALLVIYFLLAIMGYVQVPSQDKPASAITIGGTTNEHLPFIDAVRRRVGRANS